MKKFAVPERIAHDSLGEMTIPAGKYWGAQTQRSLQNFPVGTEKMPHEVIEAFAQIKAAAAEVNARLGRISEEQREAIVGAAEAVLRGELDEHFPLAVWQTGSGTQSNMNMNEVLAFYGNLLAGKELLHPNDHVNCSQSSNDTFPTAMHVAAVLRLEADLKPALRRLIDQLREMEGRYQKLLKTGRTHLQDAVPLSFGQEVSGWRSLFEHNLAQVEASLPGLLEIALGGTAVGTGLNAPKGFAEAVAEQLAKRTGLPWVSAENKMHALSSKDEFVFAHAALKSLAANWMKFANDIRWLGSGPRCGLGELQLPENEPGSSIMPGKINPTQCESATMVAAQVMGNDTTIGICASQGNFQLNVYLPVCIYNYLQSVRLLTDSIHSFIDRCLLGLKPIPEKMQENVERSLMLATALNPHIGYEKASKTARHAFLQQMSLLEAGVDLGYFSEEEFSSWVRPEEMI